MRLLMIESIAARGSLDILLLGNGIWGKLYWFFNFLGGFIIYNKARSFSENFGVYAIFIILILLLFFILWGK